MITFEQSGDFSTTINFLQKNKSKNLYKCLSKYGEKGVNALRVSTPKRTGKTSESWAYEIEKTKDSVNIYWKNSNIQDGVPIAVVIQYGHGTPSGGYVQGIDYINPAIKPIFEEILEEVWNEVTR